ncbi:MAG: MATE family efflux transporter [Pseudomonadota bacterium]
MNSPTELSLLLRIALPLSLAYLAEYAMFIMTKIVVGKLGYLELASVGISASLTFELLVVMMGLLSIVGVLCAQAEGGGEKQAAGVATRQGLLLSTIMGVPAMFGIWHMDAILEITGQDPDVVRLSRPFLHTLSFCVLPVLYFAVLRNFVSAIAKPMSVMVITVAAVGVNYLLTVWLVHGGLGLEAMGVAGAGLAMTIVSWLMFFALLGYIYITRTFRGYGVFASAWSVDFTICREIVYLGIPVAGLVLLEAGMFTAASILSGIISAETLAAYEIVVAWAGIPFVLAMGFAEGTMVRVAHRMGASELVQARRSGLLGMGTGAGILVVLMVIPLAFASVIVDIFIAPEDPGYAVVAMLATQFMIVAAAFQVFDGLQAIAARALRALKDSIAPLWIAGVGYWILGIGGGSLLAFYFGWNGLGIWSGMAMGLFTTSLLLTWRFNQLSKRIIIENETATGNKDLQSERNL